MSARKPLARRLASEDGFTMLFALAALFIGALLVAAAFSAANGDLAVTHRATVQEMAYLAAVAGVDRYQYQLTSSPEYWTKCPTLGTEAKPLTVTGAADEGYYVKTLGATGKTCESGKQATILETGGTAKGTFRILSTGTVKEGKNTVTRRIVATFAHPGFTKYVYESNYEVEDPVNFGLAPSVCEYYYAERVAKGLTTKCPPIEFAPEDKVNGSMHTNDAAEVCTSGGSAPTFGRTSSDEIEMNGGHYAAGGCSNTPNIVGKYTESAGSVLPPATDAELLEAAGLKYEGRTEIELKSGTPNMMSVSKPGEPAKTVPYPSNGVLYVQNSKTVPCAVTNYTPFGSDTVNDTGCGNVYVHGKYTESLTIASADDVIVNGSLTTTTEPNGEPNGAATLGLIAENFVRVYHPVKTRYETANVVPATQSPINGKCVTVKEVNGKIVRSNEVTELTAGGFSSGDEIEGTAGQLEGGTTISETKELDKKLKLSIAAKPPVRELSAKITNGSTEVKEVNTAGLVVGAEVEGTAAGQIEAGTTISEIKASENKIKLSKAARSAAKEVSGKILRSTEVSEINTTGLVAGEEVEGTAGLFEAGTTISEIKASEKKIKLSKAAKPPVKAISGKITSGSTEVKEITTTGLLVGDEVEGSGIEANTTITEIKASEKKIKLSKAAKKSETTTLKFYGETTQLKFFFAVEATVLKFYGEIAQLKVDHATGYAYNSALTICHKVETGYSEYRENENRYITTCEGGSENYEREGYCKIVNTSGTCSSRATNLSSTEDPNGWGVLSEPVIDAAILSTNHSWIVDNYKCGKQLGKLTVWGSIAQFWRGPVGTAGGTGYIKNYNYDNRLADQQPPSFLAPTNATSWKVSRETAPPITFTG